jgi:predicted metal-dependent peptidase
MKFARVFGKVDQNLVLKAESKLSQVFLELGLRYDNNNVGTGLGGDPLIFGLMYPIDHICNGNIKTAATDGKKFFWSPKFVLKTPPLGLRIICAHEAWHAIYMHPHRRGSRLPKLWNISVDFIVNNIAMDDLKARKFDPKDTFTKYVGRYMTLEQYASLLKDPFTPVKGFDDIDFNDTESSVKLPSPSEDRELTPQEQKELERMEKKVRFYYADPDLSEDMKRPEKIYDYLYNLLPKCPKCGRVGYYKLPPKKGKGDGSADKDKQNKDKGDKDQDQQSGQKCCGEGCPECGEGVDIFGFGDTIDDHMDTSETEEKLAKRMADAVEAAKKMAGHVPAGLEDELGLLTAPKISWQDVIRSRLLRSRSGNGRNDWTRFRSRPMFTGCLVPKRRNYFAKFGCLLDSSGSMSQDDMAYGISQLQALDERSEGTIVCCDAECYWDNAIKIRSCKIDELTKVKITGRGGTNLHLFINEYEKHIGQCDFLIVLTDAYLLDSDLANMKNPGIPVYWIVTSAASFDPPFGKVMDLKQ